MTAGAAVVVREVDDDVSDAPREEGAMTLGEQKNEAPCFIRGGGAHEKFFECLMVVVVVTIDDDDEEKLESFTAGQNPELPDGALIARGFSCLSKGRSLHSLSQPYHLLVREDYYRRFLISNPV